MSLRIFSQLFVLAGLALGSSAFAKEVDFNKDVDTLGGNKPLMDMAQALDPENRARIVQRRTVDRNDRLELGLSVGGIAGGDTYLQTHSVGLNADFHLNPHWALGLRYNDYGNDLSPEGQRMFNDYRNNVAAGASGLFPDIDPPNQSGLGLIEWYPIYGKINMFDSAIAQFDLYLLGGAGEIQLATEGWVPMYTAGGGVGFWINNNWTARIETRWQNYHDEVQEQGGGMIHRNIDAFMGSLSIGYLL